MSYRSLMERSMGRPYSQNSPADSKFMHQADLASPWSQRPASMAGASRVHPETMTTNPVRAGSPPRPYYQIDPYWQDPTTENLQPGSVAQPHFRHPATQPVAG
jgi:hypothetical protein